jgi:NADH:ubiquinone oxidoreductase subunit 6 (subunit J)
MSVAAVVVLLGFGLLNVLAGIAPLLGAPKPAPMTEDIAIALMGTHGAAFEISSLVLLAALIGAIYLAKEADR